ncbi:hypothetical protein ACFW15_13545, partial [Streptomyces sp. NPDC058953]
DSDDRLLLAEPDSGLLVVRSNAPGDDRIGWGVLGSERPVRFPDALRPPGAVVTPFAAQPGQMLRPEGCAVAFTVTTGTARRLGVWRPEGRRLHQRAAPAGWFPGAGRWDERGILRLPFATAAVPCGTALLTPPPEPGHAASPAERSHVTPPPQPGRMTPPPEPGHMPPPPERCHAMPPPEHGHEAVGPPKVAPGTLREAPEEAAPVTPAPGSELSSGASLPVSLPASFRPVPLQQAPLKAQERAG